MNDANMKKILDKTTKLIFTQQGGMFSSALILSLMIVVSRLFGFLRYRTLAGYFNKSQLDIFFASFRLPDLVFEILITGAFTASFIPIFIRYQKNKNELEENISTIFNIIILCLIVFTVISLFLMDYIVPLITPGFSQDKISQTVFYSKILLAGQLPFLIFGNFLTGIAQAQRIFFVSALAPVLYNLMVIVATFFFADRFGLAAPVWGVVVGAVIFFLIQIPVYIKQNFRYLFVLKLTKGVKEFFHMVLPRIFTVISSQIDATVDLTLASLIGAGSYTVFYLAQHLQLLPVSVIGVAFGQASLPYLSELFEESKIDELKKVIVDSILNLFFLTIPIACFFIFARTPVVRLFFGGEKYDWDATVKTAVTLSAFALALPFHSIYYFLTRCFYALLDSRTPFLASVISVLINTILSVVFIIYLKLPVWFLAISFSLSMILNVLILFFILNKKTGGLNFRFIVTETTKILAAVFIASGLTYVLLKILDLLIFDTSRTINVFFLILVGVILYLSLYLFLAWIFDIKEIYLISRLLMKFKDYQKKLLEIYSAYE